MEALSLVTYLTWNWVGGTERAGRGWDKLLDHMVSPQCLPTPSWLKSNQEQLALSRLGQCSLSLSTSSKC